MTQPHWVHRLLFVGGCLVSAAALPLVLALAVAVPIFPPGFGQLGRDWLVLLAAALTFCLLLVPFFRSVLGAAAVVAVASIEISIWPGALYLGERLGLGAAAIGAALLVALLIVVLRIRQKPEREARELMLVVAFCCAVPFALVALLSVPSYVAAGRAPETPRQAISVSAKNRPHIYHIILDELGRSDVLSQRFGLSLDGFAKALRDRGFTVSDCASANYPQTFLSLGSMLNAELLQNLTSLPPDLASRVPAKHLIESSRVLSAFRSIGYRIVWVGSGYSATADQPMADDCMCDLPWIGEFETVVLATTALGRLLPATQQAASWARYVQGRLTLIRSLPAPSEPTFTLIHILSPHDPFVFSSDGSLTRATEPLSFLGTASFKGTLQEYRAQYAAQASYVLSETLRGVDHVLEVAPPGSIIIVHGDHGPRSSQPIDPSEALPIFLAIRWPDGTSDERAPISLVNVYRRILSRYFGAGLPDLPDRHFISTFARPYDWIRVQDVACPQ